jgi:hypothetical protein
LPSAPASASLPNVSISFALKLASFITPTYSLLIVPLPSKLIWMWRQHPRLKIGWTSGNLSSYPVSPQQNIYLSMACGKSWPTTLDPITRLLDILIKMLTTKPFPNKDQDGLYLPHPSNSAPFDPSSANPPHPLQFYKTFIHCSRRLHRRDQYPQPV